MKLNNVKKTIATSAFGLVALLGMSEIATAQSRDRNDNQQPPYNQNQRVERQREEQRQREDQVSLAQQRQREEQIRLERQRQEQLRIQNQRNQNNQIKRYRIYRNGSYYQTDTRGAELLRQAVNRGYQEGFQAGQIDRRNRRNGNYNNSSVYRNGNSGYQSYIDSRQYQYYFQQGFERGYQDGYNSRSNYGTNRNGSVSILGTILQGILNIREF